MDYAQLQKDAELIAKKAGMLLKTMQSTATVAVRKDEVDIATTADLAAEKLIIDFIHKKYPDHGIYSEEMGNKPGASDFSWVIDPLDGTKEYAKNYPDYGSLVAVEEKGELVACASFIEGGYGLYSAFLGGGAFLNGSPIRVSETSDATKATISFHIPIKSTPPAEVEKDMKVLRALIGIIYRVRGFFFDAKILGLVSDGRIDAHIIPANVPQWYDAASALLLVEEAGGHVTDWNGNPIRNRDLSRGVVASNGKIHNELLTLIKESI
jgi:myo-inositol-1(or 4)-monophosphatase